MFKNIFKRTFSKYLLSYILCLILPVSIFSFLYKTIFLSAYSNQLIAKTSKSLDDAFENIDLRMSNLRDMSSQIISSRQFSNTYFNETPRILAFYTIKEILQIYTIPNEFIYNIWIFDRKNSCFYSPTHMLSLESFIRYGPRYFQINDRSFGEIISWVNDEIWIPETEVNIFDSSRSLLTYIVGYPNSYTHSNSVLVILIKQDIFDRALRTVLSYKNSAAAVIDKEKQIIYSLNHAENSTIEKILAQRISKNESGIIKIDNNDYYVKIMISPQNQLTYFSLIPYGELTRDVQKYTLIFFLILLGIMVFGSFLIFLLMQYNYKPLREILRFLHEYNGNKYRTDTGEFPAATNEIDLIHNALRTISKENITLSIKNEKYLKEELLFNLIKGSHVNSADLIKAKIDLSASGYMAVIFQLEEKKSMSSTDFGSILQKVPLPSSVNIHILEYLEQTSFIGIIICQEEASIIRDILEKLCLEIENTIKIEIQTACGSQVRHIEDISRSYSEAKTVLRYQIRNKNNRVIEFQNTKSKTIPDYFYIQAELKTLEESVKAKNSRRTAFLISELIGTIVDENTSYFYAVCLCYNIMNIFFQEIHNFKNFAALDIMKKHQMLFYENFDHPIENLVTIVSSLSHETMRVLDNEQAVARSVNRENLLRFIEANYQDSKFCIQSILDHFGMSFSNLSHQFKSFTGENISSYISTLKIKYAKELLSTSELTVNEIAAKLGYFQASSFIKKFKSIEGITPREYRRKQIIVKEEIIK